MSEPLDDPSFDVRSDTPPGLDPDAHSATLRRYHQALWSKKLHDGRAITWDISNPARYLFHQSAMGTFTLTSDSIIPTYSRWVRMAHIITQIDDAERDAFLRVAYGVAGFMVWPGDRRPGVQTINMERGTNAAISDRMDLTLECVRRHYARSPNPLERTLEAYADFFALFGDFTGFAEFFLFQDLVSPAGDAIEFFLPFHDFKGPSRPVDLAEYEDYRAATVAFLERRGERMRRQLAGSRPPERAVGP